MLNLKITRWQQFCSRVSFAWWKITQPLDTRIARHAPALWTWLHRKGIARGDWLPGDER